MTGKPLGFHEEMVPLQHEYSKHFQGPDLAAALFQRICSASGIQDAREELKLERSDKVTVEEMASNPISLRFLQMLLRLSKAKRMLEIGSFIGISGIYFARALPEDGELVTIERFDHFAAIARRNFEQNGVARKITLLEGDAHEVMATLPKDKKFDVIFIDGNKERYKDYFVIAETLLAPGGLILVDDCFFHCDAVNDKPVTEKGVGVKAFLDYAATLKGWNRVALPLSNGIMLLMREQPGR